MNATCPFCKIAAGTIDAHIVHNDGQVCAFLDRGPIRPGHLQIVPHEHVAFFDDLAPDLALAVMSVGQRLARVQKHIWGVDRVAFLFTGGDVPHVHAHLVPMHEKTDITSARYIAETDLTFRPCPRPPAEELANIASDIRTALDHETL